MFLIDREHKYTYEELKNQVNASTSYRPIFQSYSLFHYFKNLLLALVSDNPVTLIDADLKYSELSEEEAKCLNCKSPVRKSNFLSMEEILDKVRSSKSEITIFTSGTTGQPKKVVHTIPTLTRSVRISANYQAQVWAYAYNPTHMAGLQVFFQAFENLNTLVNVFNFTRQEVYELVTEYSITHISATPTFYRLLLPVEKCYATVVRVTLGGEKSDQRLYDAIRTIFPNAKINNVYASTEAGSLFAAQGENFQIPFSILDKIKIEDDELLIHKSLLGRSDSFAFVDDYYSTGDLIEWIDKSLGIFKFKSRKNELINIGGYKVNPGETEQAILQIEGIQQVIVYGKANSVLGNVLCAEVKLLEGIEVSELEIKKKLKQQLQDFKIPRKIKFVKEFSLTRTGKLKRL